MTREEFKDEMNRYRVPLYAYLYVDELEAKIAKLEAPKSCDGCKHGVFGVDSSGIEVECKLTWNCSRGHDDRYESKDNK